MKLYLYDAKNAVVLDEIKIGEEVDKVKMLIDFLETNEVTDCNHRLIIAETYTKEDGILEFIGDI